MNRIWGTSTQSHGGVIPENVKVADNGDVIIAVNGDYYEGSKRGVSIDDPAAKAPDGTSTGGVITTRQAYGPGSFEAVMKIPSINGVCTSLWLYNYWESGSTVNNHEIDIELHGTVSKQYSEHDLVGTYTKALFTSWLTETDRESEYIDVGYPLNDGAFHRYRIDWHTNKDGNAVIYYYIDGRLLCTQTTYVPDNKMYVNIGCWFPNDWCGNPNFETDSLVLRSFTYTSFDGETAKSANASGQSESIRYSAVPTSGYGFESNLIANGGFDNSRENYIWTFGSGTTPTKTNGSVSFTGEMSQEIELDCASLPLVLKLTGSGSATVTVEYGSIVDGVTVTGSKSFTFADGGEFTFTPPTGCTKLTVRISSASNVTVTGATLGHASAA